MTDAILILGGSSQLTPLLLARFGSDARVVVTTTSEGQRFREWPNVTELSFPREAPEALVGKLEGRWKAVISLVPITALPSLLQALEPADISRFVALSTASTQTKVHTRSMAEAAFLASVRAGESAFHEFIARRAIPGVLLRPAMTYGGADNNVGFIRRMGRAFGFFPVVSSTGMRQPVHVDDVVGAIMAALTNPAAAGNTYFLGGGEQLTFEEMARRILRDETGRERIIRVPAPLLILALRMLSLIPRFRYLDSDMVRRMREHHVFDNAPAERDLGFSPRKFLAETSGLPESGWKG